MIYSASVPNEGKQDTLKFLLQPAVPHKWRLAVERLMLFSDSKTCVTHREQS